MEEVVVDVPLHDLLSWERFCIDEDYWIQRVTREDALSVSPFSTLEPWYYEPLPKTNEG